MPARNSPLVPGVWRLTRTQVYKAKALFKRKNASPASTKNAIIPRRKFTPKKAVTGPKGPTTVLKRVVPKQERSFYPAEDIPKPKISRKVAKPAKLRSSIIPGTILILLAGRFRGKRVVFLKQLDSGLLLVTGPFKVNGVPLRRVNQAYVIATSTQVDISNAQIDEKFNDAFFKKEKVVKKKGTEEEFFGDNKKSKEPFPESKAADQKALDKAILTSIAQVPSLRSYLTASFSLSKGQFPHTIKF